MFEARLKRSDVGEFTGNYAITVTTCRDLFENIPTEQRVLGPIASNGGADIRLLREWADKQVADHLKSHEKRHTPPCRPEVSPMYAVHTDALDPNRIIWVPTS